MILSIFPFILTFTSVSLVRDALGNESTVQHVAALDDFLAENLAVRSNGQVLVTTSAPVATLRQIDPFAARNGTLAVRFSSVSGSYGITELQTDMFYVTAENFSIQTRRPVLQSFKFFEVDITVYHTLPNGSVAIPPKLRQVTTFVDAIVLNGFTHVDGQDGYVLIADSYAGVIWKVDIGVGSVTTAINDTSMAPTATKAAEINRLRYQNGYLYYTNTATNSQYRIPVYPNVTASGNPSSLRRSRKETISYWTDLEQATYVSK